MHNLDCGSRRAVIFVTFVSARRSALGLKVSLVMIHVVYAGILFLFDGDLIEKTKTEPWYVKLTFPISQSKL